MLKNTKENGKNCTISEFGKLSTGEFVQKIELKNEGGIQLTLMNYGATAVSLFCPDKNGLMDDILLGFDTLEGFLNNSYFGSTIGRFANRICKGRFSLDNKEFQLNCNNNGNHLHGGIEGWDKKVWQFDVNETENSVCFFLESHDLEEKYPGEVKASVVYQLSDENEISINFSATTNQKTLINMTNHAFFNLSGKGTNTDILDHMMHINSASYLPVNEELIPTGEVKDVTSVEAFDFRITKAIGRHISQAGGYDHNYCFEPDGGDLRAKVYHELSGRVLEVRSTLPGMQFYSGNFLDGMVGKMSNKYEKHTGFALEPQFYPDNINQDKFQSSITEPGQEYKHYIKWKLSVHG